ncbi:MAG: hypothetical protein HFH14_11155 [Lachnospiraceae bacterium]|nr:hypothetical protein [Lachnospiraceae bacterium]
MNKERKKKKTENHDKKNLSTLITYFIAACVVLVCLAAVIMGITGNNTDTSSDRTGSNNAGLNNDVPDNTGSGEVHSDNKDSDEDFEIPFSLFE